MKTNYTHVSVLLDRSGSMATIASDTIGGFNTFISDQKKVPGEMTLTLCQFDTVYDNLYNFVDIQKVVPLTVATFVPRGMTSLLDSVARIIVDTGRRLSNLPEDERPDRVMVVIITDGQENSSVEQTKQSISAMVKHQEDNYRWQFTYLGANQDAFTEAMSMGIRTSANYKATGQGVNSTYSALSANVTRNRGTASGQSVNLTQEDVDNS